MSVLFLGHGSPMNAINDNAYTQRLTALGGSLARPRAIVVISAHWLTEGTFVTGMERPRTIHDFYGFPDELYSIQYPAPGAPELASVLAKEIGGQVDETKWGLDHGSWGVLMQLYPKADIPVVQVSLDINQPPSYHFEMGKKLRSLPGSGVLVIASGNVVHNLRAIQWQISAPPHPWAIKFDQWVKTQLLAGNTDALIHHFLDTEEGKKSIPTPDHYIPLMWALGAAGDPLPQAKIEYEEIQNASISMLCASWG